MRGWHWLGCLAALAISACGPSKPQESAALAWAYPKGPPSKLPAMPPGLQHVPGSRQAFTLEQVNDENTVVDWFPEEHSPAPSIIAHAPKGGPMPCGACHSVDGHGFPGVADIAGLPAAYIIEQVKAFRSGERTSSQQPDRPDTTEMIKVARTVSDADLVAAAQWFSVQPRHARVRVVETDTVPRTTRGPFGFLAVIPGGGSEPIDGRIIEVTEDAIRLNLGDPHAGVIDYAPKGSVARGLALVQSGGPNGQPCSKCHGKDLKGAVGPPLTGRAATYLARMLWDIKSGARSGPTVAQMKGPASQLNEAQITDISAYLASLQP